MTFTKPSFHNSDRYQVSYYRMYKSASSTILNILTDHTQEHKSSYPVFTVIRNPFTRAKSIYRQMIHMNKTKLSFLYYLLDIKDNGVYDKHQLTQSELLSYCNEPCKLFTLEDYKWVDHIGYKQHIQSKNVRQLTEDSFTPEEIELINDIYGSDVDLYLSIN